jgi:hypothetical protein
MLKKSAELIDLLPVTGDFEEFLEYARQLAHHYANHISKSDKSAGQQKQGFVQGFAAGMGMLRRIIENVEEQQRQQVIDAIAKHMDNHSNTPTPPHSILLEDDTAEEEVASISGDTEEMLNRLLRKELKISDNERINITVEILPATTANQAETSTSTTPTKGIAIEEVEEDETSPYF